MTARRAVEVVTFGCRLNGVESDAMQTQAQAAGWDGLTIVNTCTVTAEAARQARQTIRRLRREAPDRRLVVTGCASETDSAGFAAMPEVDAVIPNARKTAADTWRREGSAVQGAPATALPRTRGFVEVQNGCDHRCTFCIIPFGRGASRSKSVAEVVDRVRTERDRGAGEVVLTGVDVTAFGNDLAGRPTLGTLVQAVLAQVPDLPRLRLSSLDCIEADPALLEALPESRLMPHLHLSVQAGSDLILTRMKRRHRRADVMAFCDHVRSLRPDMAFGADIIAGFPTETDAMFGDTLDLIARCGFSYLHAFPFSARPGTPAARMPPVRGEVVKARAARLRDAGQSQLQRHLEGQRDRVLTVLAEHGDKGHAEDFTLVRLPPGTRPGTILRVRAEAHDGRSLSGSPVMAGLKTLETIRAE